MYRINKPSNTSNTNNIKFLKLATYLGSTLFLAACSSNTSPSKLNTSVSFPKTAKIEPMVDFWKKVYSKWDLNVVVIHDNRYLNMIYEEIKLPQGATEGYTADSQALIKSRFSSIESQMFALDKKLASAESLNTYERQIVTQLKKVGGSAALVNIGERVRVQRGISSRYKAGLEHSYAYLPYFKSIFKKEGLPEELAYLPHVESSFVNKARSNVGAAGMWQFMPSTGREYLPMSKTVDGRLDPIIAAKGAAQYLGAAHRHLNSWPLAITSYNHGVGGMAKAKAQQGNNFDNVVWNYDGARFGFASRNFYTAFLAAKEIATEPSKYFTSYTPHKPLMTESIQLSEAVKPADLARYFNVPAFELIRLNPAWISNFDKPTDTLPAGMKVWLPKGTLKLHRVPQDLRIAFSPGISATSVTSAK